MCFRSSGPRGRLACATLALALAGAVMAACPQPQPTPPADGPSPPTPSPTPMPPPTPTVLADASPDAGPVCIAGCAALILAGCPLGQKPDCAAVLGRDLASGKLSDPGGRLLTCSGVGTIRTKADAVKLGFTCQ